MPQVTFVHISDTHIHSDPTYTREGAPPSQAGAKALVAQINTLPFPVDFVLHTGDVAYDPHEDAYESCKTILREIRAPVYYVAGNHDDSAALQKTLIPDQAPQEQLHYTVDIHGVQLVVVDSNGPAAPPAGFMTDSQLDWLGALCRAEDPRPLIVATHHNPIGTDIPWLDDYMGIQNSAALHAALHPARHRLRGVFFGHVHQNIDLYRDGILYASTLSSWVQFNAYPGMKMTAPDTGAPPGYSVVTVNAHQTFIRRCRFDVPGVSR